MRRALVAPLLLLFGTSASVALFALACGDPYAARTGLDTEPDEAGGTTTSRDGGSSSGDPLPLPDAGGASGRVLAHTGKTLFRLEPETKRLTKLGDFDCLEQGDDVLDIAVDRTGAAFATSFRGFLTVDPISAKCVFVNKSPDYPNSLSFMPVGTVDSSSEALVGYAFEGAYAVRYVRIDPRTGAMTDLGTLNPAAATTEYVSSGDLVGLINDGNRAYLTVRQKPGTYDAGAGVPTDRLAEIDPAKGTLKRILGDTTQRNLYGFGYWSGHGYGFADDGTVAEIDMKTGKGTPLQTIGVTEKQKWYGAGVSTQAPVR